MEESYWFYTLKSEKQTSHPQAIPWTSLFADLSGGSCAIPWEVVEAVPVGHDLDAVQQHVRLLLEEMVLALLEHQHVVLQLHRCWVLSTGRAWKIWSRSVSRSP